MERERETRRGNCRTRRPQHPTDFDGPEPWDEISKRCLSRALSPHLAVSLQKAITSPWSPRLPTSLPSCLCISLFFPLSFPHYPLSLLSAFSLFLSPLWVMQISNARLENISESLIILGQISKRWRGCLGKNVRKAERGHFNGKEVIIEGHSRWNAAESFDD